MWYIGVDIGGTNIDCVAVSDKGERSEYHHVRPTDLTPEEAATEACLAFIRSIGARRQDIGVVGIGWKHGRHEKRVLGLETMFAKAKLSAKVSWDAETAFLGALPKSSGILVLSGTGSCVYGKTASGKVLSRGGWSPLFGDPGSAFAIGQQAVIAAIRTAEKVNEAKALLEEIPKFLHLSLDDLVVMTDANLPAAVPKIASISQLIFRLADQGDVESIRIRAEGAESLAERIMSLTEAWPGHEEIKMSYAGRLMHAQPVYRQLIRDALQHHKLNLTWKDPAFLPPFGAILSVYPKLLPVLEQSKQSLYWHH